MIIILQLLVNRFGVLAFLLSKLFWHVFYPILFLFIVICSLESPLMLFLGTTALRQRNRGKRHSACVLPKQGVSDVQQF